MKLYHTSNQVIQNPDIHFGRKNADFGWGFYLTPDRDFACRWAVEDAVLNEYELDLEGLHVHRLSRDEEWFQYIVHNRRAEDCIEADVIIGPIANDILFDTLGIISSGVLSPETALRLLLVGPEYTQIAIKSEKAASQLHWIRAEKIPGIDRSERQKEEDAYLSQLSEILDS